MRNRFLQDRASKRYNSRGMRISDRAMDGRNPYGSRGGYVVSSRMRGRDREMVDRNYYPEYSNRYNSSYDRPSTYSNYNYGSEHYGEHSRPMDYEMYAYGVGSMRPSYEMDYASEDMDKEYHEKLEHWIKKLKQKDRFGLPKEEVIRKAKEMGVRFEKFEEIEFYAIYLMMVSDYKQLANDPHMYLALTKDWLEDDDVEMKGSEKVCAYLYSIVLGEDE